MDKIDIAVKICEFIIVILVMLLYIVLHSGREADDDDTLKARKELIDENRKQERIKNFGENLFAKNRKKYNEIQIYLSQVGVNYMMKRVVDPIEFLAAKVIIAVLVCMAGYTCKGLIGAAIGLFVGYNILNWLLNMSNKRDNDAIIHDIRSIYETIIQKVEGGVFLSDAIMECYKVTKNERLKKELLQLSGEISTKNNVLESVEKFKLKFKNRYITTFCTIIKQSFKSGETLNALVDVAKQLDSIQAALELKEKEKLDAQIMITEFLILGDMIIIILYALIYNLSNIFNTL